MKRLVRSGPTIRRGKSKQDYKTDPLFMNAIRRRFGAPVFDLAASPTNTQCKRYFSVADNSLAQQWHPLSKRGGWLFLNPPFDNIAPWARKCALESKMGARILFLTPASVGANWFAQYVHGYALVLALNGRLCFDGKNGYPKDLMLSVYDGTAIGFDTWRWREAR